MGVTDVLKARRTEVLTMVLPIQLKSKNERDKLHFRARHALRIDYQNIVSLKHPRKSPTPTYKQLVTVTRIMGPRERDWDINNGYAGSMTELLDSLVHLGWLVDDSPRYLIPEFRQMRHPVIKGPAVLIELREVVS